MKVAQCADCYFYDHVEVGGGVCRRNPPHPFAVPAGTAGIDGKIQIAVRSFQAPTEAKGWCGEFVDRSEADVDGEPDEQPQPAQVN